MAKGRPYGDRYQSTGSSFTTDDLAGPRTFFFGRRTGDDESDSLSSGLDRFSSLSLGDQSSADINDGDAEALQVRWNVNVGTVSGGGAPKRDPLTRDPHTCASSFGIFV